MAAKLSQTFVITGIEESVLKNVQKRLEELSRHQILNHMDKALLEEHVRLALQPYGYFRASCIVHKNPDKRLEIDINPGPRMFIQSLQVQVLGAGKNNAVIKKNLTNLPLQPGDPLLTERYNQAKMQIVAAAEKEGFLAGDFSQSEIRIDTLAYNASVTLVFDTGPQFRFGKALFSSGRLSPALLDKYLPFTYGETFSAKKILALNKALSKSGYFKKVSVVPIPEKDLFIPVKIVTEPQQQLNYSLSAGYGTDTGIRGKAGFSVIPVNSRGDILRMLLQGSFTENLLQMQYHIPGADPIRENYLFAGTAATQQYDNDYGKRILLSAAHNQQHRWFQHNLSLNALIEKFHYEYKPDITQKLFFPKLQLTHKKQADSLFSPSGYYLNFTVSGSRNKWLSKLSFVKTTLEAKAAWMFEPVQTRLLLHASLASIQTSDVYALPLSMALLLGSTQNMKGYAFNSIGPGKKLVYLGLEVQKAFKPNWYMIGFFDAGNVFDPAPVALNYDIGAGLMWVSPVGPIKIGVAKPLGKKLPEIDQKNLRLIVTMASDL